MAKRKEAGKYHGERPSLVYKLASTSRNGGARGVFALFAAPLVWPPDSENHGGFELLWEC